MIDLTGQSRRSAVDSLSPAMEVLLQQQAADWMQGTRRPVHAYLQGHPVADDRRALLLELVYQEVLLRQMRGEMPVAENYAAEFPELSNSIHRLFEIQALQASTDESRQDRAAASGASHEPGSNCKPRESTKTHPDEAPMSSPAPGPDELPSQFGRYRVIKRLGRGGMGVVYLAQDRELDRLVALKLPREEYERHPEALARFQNEARAAAAVDHPNFCRVYEVGQVDDRHYIAMAYIDGYPLSTLIDPCRPMDPKDAVNWVLRLALIMAELHERGIVHRDLKPSNVMVDRRGEPIIMDFGLAPARRRKSRFDQNRPDAGQPPLHGA